MDFLFWRQNTRICRDDSGGGGGEGGSCKSWYFFFWRDNEIGVGVGIGIEKLGLIFFWNFRGI